MQRLVSYQNLGNLTPRLNRANLNSALNRFHEYPPYIGQALIPLPH